MRQDYKLIVEGNEVRGLHCLSLTPDFMVRMGRAYGRFVRDAYGYKPGKPHRLVLGFDARPSSVDLQNSLQRGLAAEGVNVLNLGVAPAPLVYFAIHHLKTEGGIVVTGSHRPSGWNGVRFYLGRQPLPERATDELLSCSRHVGCRDLLPMLGDVTYLNMVPDYIRTLGREFKPLRAQMKSSPISVVVAGGNGAASLTAPAALSRIGCRVIKLGCSMQGPQQTQAHDPSDPLFLNEAGATVRASKADFGVLFDGDGDRIRVVDHRGEPVRADHLLMLFAQSVASQVKKARVASDLRTSDALEEILAGHSATALHVPPVHTSLMEVIQNGSVQLAGSSDGHYHFTDRSLGFDDGLYAILRLVEILAAKREEGGRRLTLRSILPKIDRYISPEKIIPARGADMILEPVAEYLRDCIGNGGGIESVEEDQNHAVRVRGTEAWGVIALEPGTSAIHIRYEGTTEEAFRRIGSILRESLEAGMASAGPPKRPEPLHS